MRSPELKYLRRKHLYDMLLKKQTKTIGRISNLRLLSFVSAAAFAISAFAAGHPVIFGTIAVASLTLFIYLVRKHEKCIKSKLYCSLLSGINSDSYKRIKGEWTEFQDAGMDFTDYSHPYTQDLDIFGSNSLFQMISTAVTFSGRHKLSKLLAGKPGTAEEIFERQEAVTELASKLSWRQRFQAEAINAASFARNPDDLIKWAGSYNKNLRKPWLIAIIRLAPVITLALCILSFALHLIPYYVPIAALATQYGFLTVKKKKRHKTFVITDNYANNIRVYYKMLRMIEKQPFKALHLKNIKDPMNNQEGLCPSKQLDKLSRIIDSMSNRYTPFYFIFNTLVLWDFQNMIALAKWKETCGSHVESWLDVTAEFEALSSLAIVQHDNPDWAMPVFAEADSTLYEAKGMGHPLLTTCRINNDLDIKNPEKVLLVTGSNMSGKSTLLRTAGINLVLAYAGALVCAEAFHVSIMDIYTCMRVSDSLGKSISSFYAELLRIKIIITEATEGRKVFFLLDEIFKGTNSRDRHTGARELINKLSNTRAVGLVSTHDLELCTLEDENRKVKNYHFQEYYENGGIHFDYKLRPGASTTSNAIYLMKMAGIDL